jgi:putative transposase
MNRACDAVGLSRATAYRRLKPKAARPPLKRSCSERRIPNSERTEILAVLDSEQFLDQPPREVYAALLTEGTYLCSVRTMYRILNERSPVHDRRNQREPRSFAVPRLEASAPNSVWTWDISKLPTIERGVFLNLYVILDLFSRFVVAWMVASRENAALAKQLFGEAISRYDVAAGNLIVHQDRGAPMTSHGFAELLSELGVERSYSRPRVSNDNPFSESHFHTVKYQPDYPGRFKDVRHARRWCTDFFQWYNYDHHHDGLALFTPADVFFGRVDVVAQSRERALAAAYAAHPERFVNGPPRVRRPPSRVLINPAEPGIVTAEKLIQARDSDVASLWTPPQSPSTAPIIHLPGVTAHNRGAELTLPS